MVRIEIDNAGATPAHELRAIAACLIAIAAGDSGATHTETTTVGNITRTVTETPAKRAEKVTPLPTIIAAADLPDAGAPTLEPVAIGEPLREPAIDPKVAFAAPNAPASCIAGVSQSPTVPAVPQATSTTTASVPLPPVPPAPATDAQQDEGAPSDAQFDKTGLPWDARIHSRGRSMTAAGTWRAKRGVDDATVARVAAELRAVPGVPVGETDVAAAEAAWPFKVPGIVPPPPPPVSNVVSFPAFMGKYVPHIEPAGPIKQSQLTAILVAHGVPSLPLLSARTDLLPAISAQLDAIIAAAA